MPDNSPVGLVSVISPSFAQEGVEAQRLDRLPGVTAELAREPAVQTLIIAPHDMRQPELPVEPQLPKEPAILNLGTLRAAAPGAPQSRAGFRWPGQLSTPRQLPPWPLGTEVSRHLPPAHLSSLSPQPPTWLRKQTRPNHTFAS